jgi:hypothetical protein
MNPITTAAANGADETAIAARCRTARVAVDGL